MNFCNIKTNDVADGEGVRVALFVSGCTHHCKGCFQPETWSFDAGSLFDEAAEEQIIKALSKPYIQGFTLLGGEPFEPENQRGEVGLLKRIRRECPDKTVWVYTGYTLDRDIIPEDGRARCEVTDELLSCIDVCVDGEFILEQKSLLLPFRGSENQRILDVPETLKSGFASEYRLKNPR